MPPYNSKRGPHGTTNIHPERPAVVLIAGCTGFIGTDCVRTAIATICWSIIVVDKLTYADNLSNLHGLSIDRVEVVIGDICDQDTANDLDNRADVILNFVVELHNDW